MSDKPLKNLRHETFCQNMALGTYSASEAYRQSGYNTKNADVRSAELVVKSGIKERIAEIRAKLAEKIDITHEKYIQMAVEQRDLAIGKSDVSGANGALTIIGRACGYDKTITETADLPHLTPEEAKEAKLWARIEQEHSPETVAKLLQEHSLDDNRPDSDTEQEAGTAAGSGACQAQEEQEGQE